jgi:hypothetical protein
MRVLRLECRAKDKLAWPINTPQRVMASTILNQPIPITPTAPDRKAQMTTPKKAAAGKLMTETPKGLGKASHALLQAPSPLKLPTGADSRSTRRFYLSHLNFV